MQESLNVNRISMEDISLAYWSPTASKISLNLGNLRSHLAIKAFAFCSCTITDDISIS